ncbi:hypothetical protein Slin_5271 [Spirosoma linguale DSM 74]|uniref:Uncharacterized protein n=1 Tax=Spirosoma linguale (strain ATCC 33905 / DSM 74 / LMG 10896 / Claus 1) TaxID=504472 RepID=D2QE26_SPILD|nr:hypothetical protein Slin_5271 [Spirosoma linguale DSM 74]
MEFTGLSHQSNYTPNRLKFNGKGEFVAIGTGVHDYGSCLYLA